jgi:sulfate/thiosulfate transport system substrate-binding protein
MKTLLRGAATALVLSALAFAGSAHAVELMNVSYDPTRELYEAYNAAFAEHWKAEKGEDVTVSMSHGGSGKQARSVIDGLEADVVTLALAPDIDEIAKRSGLIPEDWASKLPHDSAPYTSTVVFLVRKGNPKGIKDWNDLVRDEVEVITPNPKTSGNGRWSYLGAWAYAAEQFGKDEAKVRDFMAKLYANVPVLDTGARGSTTTFAQRGIGDVLIGWENEAFLALEELGPDQFEIVVPSMSVLAQPTVAVVEGNAEKHGTSEVAKAYLEYLYSPEGQAIAAKHFYRPVSPEHAAKEDVARFPQLRLVSVQDAFGGWEGVAPHFVDGGTFDQIYKPAGQ